MDLNPKSNGTGPFGFVGLPRPKLRGDGFWKSWDVVFDLFDEKGGVYDFEYATTHKIYV